MDIVLKHDIENDRYTEYIYEAFDIQNKQTTETIIANNIHLERFDFEWQIGVIYGGSGSGKSTLLKQFGEISQPEFSKTKPLISNFDFVEPKDAAMLLASMGLASVPSWLRPFHTLSNGEQYRATLAYIVGKAQDNELILVDEYTSVVDRDVAKAMSNALQKYIRRTKKKIILASCHFDIMDWLQPDWIYSPNKRRVERREYLRLARPAIQLEVFRCRYSAWALFQHHHYLSEELNKAAKCFIFTWNDQPVCFVGILPSPSGYYKDAFRVTRVVVLPDFQGLGVGNKAINYIAALYKKTGKDMYIKTSNPALGEAQLKSGIWKETATSRKILSDKSYKSSAESSGWGLKGARFFYSFKYFGGPDTTEGSERIVVFNADAYNDVAQNQSTLF